MSRLNVINTQRIGIRLLAALAVAALSGCGMLGSSGPSAGRVEGGETAVIASGIKVVDVSDSVARRLSESQKRLSFSEVFGSAPFKGYVVGAGDILAISIWEAPPGGLFSAAALNPGSVGGGTPATGLPDQMVNADGTINIPFAGSIPAAGKSIPQLEALVVRKLTGKAMQPQVMIRVVKNTSSNVTVVGEVSASMQMPLTAKGERLLDALAAAGGVKQPVGKTTVQVTRGKQVQSLALDTVIQNPAQNIPLQPGDVVTALHQPLSFTALGAVSANQEIQYEAQGITLAQALARAGGLQDVRANAQGVFIFRFEDPATLGGDLSAQPMTPAGKVPVVYRVDLKDPGSFFVAQGFPMRDKDVMYVANAPAAELQKFLTMLASLVFSARGLSSLGQ